MSDLLSPALGAVLARLRADVPLGALLGTPPRLFDHMPTGSTFPYVVMTQGEGRDAGAKGLGALNVTLLFAVHHRDRTGAEARQILAAVRDCLHDATLSGVARCQEEFVGITGEHVENRRAVARYRLVLGI